MAAVGSRHRPADRRPRVLDRVRGHHHRGHRDTRAIVQWGGPDAAANFTEQQNALIDAWEATIEEACR